MGRVLIGSTYVINNRTINSWILHEYSCTCMCPLLGLMNVGILRDLLYLMLQEVQCIYSDVGVKLISLFLFPYVVVVCSLYQKNEVRIWTCIRFAFPQNSVCVCVFNTTLFWFKRLINAWASFGMWHKDWRRWQRTDAWACWEIITTAGEPLDWRLSRLTEDWHSDSSGRQTLDWTDNSTGRQRRLNSEGD